jgi:hypothetical protein
VREPVYYGPDPAVAFDVIRGLRSTRDLLAGLDTGEAERALDRLRATLAATRPSAACSSTRAPGSLPPGAAENSVHCPVPFGCCLRPAGETCAVAGKCTYLFVRYLPMGECLNGSVPRPVHVAMLTAADRPRC